MSEFEQLGQCDSRVMCIRTHFDFLENQLGFQVTQANDQVVRWERGKVYLCCNHGALDSGLRITFGPLRAPGQSENTFDEEDLPELLEGDRQPPWQAEPIRSISQFEELVQCAAILFQREVLPRIREQKSAFDKLAKARDKRKQKFGRSRSQELAQGLLAQVRVQRNHVQVEDAAAGGRRPMDPAGLEVLAHAVRTTRPILENFHPDGDPLQHKRSLALLRPKPSDYQQLFKPGVAATATAKYTTIWQHAQKPPVPRPGQTELVVDACFSEWLLDENELTARFPAGYQWIAPQLRPGCIWMCWRYVQPGSERGSAFNGLVYLGHRWTWLPNPHRVLTGS